MILTIDPGLTRVSKDHHAWFCKAARGKKIEHSNGVGTYLDDRLVAAELDGIGGKLFYVRTKGVLK